MEYKLIKIEDEDYPTSLKSIKDPPQELYVMGNVKILNKTCFSIIGSRKCTDIGIKRAQKIAKQLCEYNLCIVSGMALGIDTAAHTGTILAGGETIAVLGTGLNNIYPKQNINLAKEIVNTGGAIITEYEPNEKVNPRNFPQRNRIISGLSIGTLVVEAHYRSGTTITARLAKNQGRKVFAIPNTIDNKYGVITNELIKDGAILTRNVNDIVSEYDFLKKQKKKIVKEFITNIDTVPEKYRKIYNVLSTEKINIEEIAKKLCEPISCINSTLTMMELEGFVKKFPGEFYERK